MLPERLQQLRDHQHQESIGECKRNLQLQQVAQKSPKGGPGLPQYNRKYEKRIPEIRESPEHHIFTGNEKVPPDPYPLLPLFENKIPSPLTGTKCGGKLQPEVHCSRPPELLGQVPIDIRWNEKSFQKEWKIDCAFFGISTFSRKFSPKHNCANHRKWL